MLLLPGDAHLGHTTTRRLKRRKFHLHGGNLSSLARSLGSEKLSIFIGSNHTSLHFTPHVPYLCGIYTQRKSFSKELLLLLSEGKGMGQNKGHVTAFMTLCSACVERCFPKNLCRLLRNNTSCTPKNRRTVCKLLVSQKRSVKQL